MNITGTAHLFDYHERRCGTCVGKTVQRKPSGAAEDTWSCTVCGKHVGEEPDARHEGVVHLMRSDDPVVLWCGVEATDAAAGRWSWSAAARRGCVECLALAYETVLADLATMKADRDRLAALVEGKTP